MNAPKTSRSTGRIRSAFIILITSFLLIGGHSQAAGQADPQAMASGYFDWLLGRGNAVATAALVSPTTVLHTPEGVFRGQDGLDAFGSQLGASFSNLEFEVQSADIAGDRMVVEFTMTGVHTGMYQGMDWNCAHVSAPGVAVLQTGDDGFSEQWITYDQQTLLDQIYVFSLTPDFVPSSCEISLVFDNPLSEPIAVPESPAGPPQCLTKTLCETAF